jgi:solute carrier family 39 (zinc transporter), member 1/2/3
MDEDNCSGEAVDVGNRGLRIGAIFIIMAASAVGAFSPIILSRQSKFHVPKLSFFICKYIGTGVIIATAWLHLLDPAVENLSDECLEPRLGDYPWPMAIGLWTIMVMFLIEMLAARSIDHADASSPSQFNLDPAMDIVALKNEQADGRLSETQTRPQQSDIESQGAQASSVIPGRQDDVSYPPGGEDHLAHRHDHKEGDSHNSLASQLLAIFILEFGVVFHSVFIGLTLGTTDELTVLLVVLVFHQMFEGLGLGSRLAISPWPKDKGWLPYLLAALFCLSTPVGIAAGIGAQPNNASDQKLVNGIFDSISAGILMYTGLVELLAHEFMFNPYMRKAPLKIQLFAYACVLFGMAVMAILAKWA